MRLWLWGFYGLHPLREKYTDQKKLRIFVTFHSMIVGDARILINGKTDKAIVVITFEDCFAWTCLTLCF